MYREIPCQSRALQAYYTKIEIARQQKAVLNAKPVIDTKWGIPTDPNGERIKPAKSLPRRDGVTQTVFQEIDRQNKILLSKMGAIMKGKYSSSTKDDFNSSKFILE